MTEKQCPHCSRPIAVRLEWYDDDPYDDDPYVVLDRVPLRDQPCTPRRYGLWRCWAYSPGVALETDVRFNPVRSMCNWLGARCNDASHVTPCDTRRRPAKSALLRGCKVDTQCRRNSVLARCVQGGRT